MDFAKFERNAGIQINNRKLIKQAFVHRSYVNENRDYKGGHNERLEFLGDAVLELVVTSHLYSKYPDRSEGLLTAYRSALVNTNSLSHAAQNLQMNDFLLLSKGEAKDTGRARQYILANTFEALIGAIYLDQGYDAAASFIARHLLHLIDDIVKNRLWQDNKSLLQEKSQETLGFTPTYKVHAEEGPDHGKIFTIGVYINDSFVAEGRGVSKQEAEQNAALEALKVKGWH
jgi:ribonuclease III